MPAVGAISTGSSGLGSLSTVGAGLGSVFGSAFAATPFGQEIARFKSQKSFRDDSYAATKRSVDTSLVQQYGALQRQQLEEAESFRQSSDEVTRRAASAAASANVTAAEAGVSGLGAAEVLTDIGRRESQQQQALLRAYQIRERAILEQGPQLQQNAYQKLLSGIGGPIAKPDYFGATMDVAKFGALFI